MVDQVAIGIDLGTTNCCVALINNGSVHTCINNEGDRTTPSYVCYTDKECLVGKAAKTLCYRFMESTIYDSKRLIGRSYDDSTLNKLKDSWPFKIKVVNGELKIEIQTINQVIDNSKGQFEYKPKLFLPEEISKLLLEKMKEYAETYLDKKVDSAVITVPANFNDAQRQATKVAASLAGIKVLMLVNEPTAAAFAYGLANRDSKNRSVLVFDLGGGTFDVSILNIFNTKVKVTAITGDNYLGGQDFDNNLLNHCLKQIKEKHKIDLINIASSESKKAIARLRNACELGKIYLSNVAETTIAVDILYNQIDFELKIAKARFESLNENLFKRCMDIVDICVKEAEKRGIKKENLDVILVGGSTRIPKIVSLLEDKFTSSKVKKNSINVDEAVAQGAAILADILMKAKSKGIQDDSLRDVTPLSLGVESNGGLMSVILPKYTEIPTKLSKIYSTVEEDQESILISVYEGERAMVEDNNLLKEFEITEIPHGPKGVVKIEVTFEIDCNSILIVSAIEKKTGIKKVVTIANEKGRLTDDDIKRIKEEEEKNKYRDTIKKEALIAKNKLMQYLEKMKLLLRTKDIKEKLTPDQISELNTDLENAIYWNEFNPSEEKEEFNDKRSEIEKKYKKMINL